MVIDQLSGVNAQLFDEPYSTKIEQALIRPDENPRKAILMLKAFMDALKGDEDWQKHGIPCCRAVEMRTPPNRIQIDSEIHVRGGWDLSCDSSAYIRGPVILGRGVKIRSGAVITGPTIIGDNVTIGQGCRIKSSIIRSGARIVFATRVAHSVIGAHSVLGPNVTINDEDLDGRPLVGLVTGDRCLIGGGVTFAPGVILASNTLISYGRRILVPGLHGGDIRDDIL